MRRTYRLTMATIIVVDIIVLVPLGENHLIVISVMISEASRHNKA